MQMRVANPIFQLVKNYFIDQLRAKTLCYVYTLKIMASFLYKIFALSLFLNWDMSNYANNKIQFDSSKAMGISYATDTNLYCRLNYSLKPYRKALCRDNIAGIDPVINAVDGLSDLKKFICLSNHRDSAGSTVLQEMILMCVIYGCCILILKLTVFP